MNLIYTDRNQHDYKEYFQLHLWQAPTYAASLK
jgi:hypothetical protein